MEGPGTNNGAQSVTLPNSDDIVVKIFVSKFFVVLFIVGLIGSLWFSFKIWHRSDAGL